jgi:hypothetical protein
VRGIFLRGLVDRHDGQSAIYTVQGSTGQYGTVLYCILVVPQKPKPLIKENLVVLVWSCGFNHQLSS